MDEDIVQIQFNNCSTMNFLLPLLVGGPDMAKNKDILGSIKNNKYYSKSVKSNNNLKTYLAGLFEGDGHIWIHNSYMKKKHNPRFCITFKKWTIS